ncbi:Hydantoinase/oxoprolinase [Hysterangium stoloniferum]|nr:Hydantoinase/oxoprolinase [Hysterangium stoloniferum]
MPSQQYRIGVDVGGTYTDAVLLQVGPTAASSPDRGISGSFKHPTTASVSDGIEAAVRIVLEQTQISPEQVDSLMIGNAVVEADARRLSKVAVIRLGAPYTEVMTWRVSSFFRFPLNLRAIIEGHTAIVKGGLEIDSKIINEIDESELVEEGRKIKTKNLTAIAIIGIFSPLDKSDGTGQEERAKAILSRELGPSVDIVCSRDVGQVGLLERENATIVNASIIAFARRTINGFQRAMHRLGLSCPLYLTQNDGTLTSAHAAARLPIRTFSSGATNSMRGAAYLSGLSVKDAKISSDKGSEGSIIVVDIGGTTTDVGVLLSNGFPRQAAAFIKVGGVRTNFSMPDVYSIGLGGGSKVRPIANKVTVGPDSTGYQLLTEGLIFGGKTLTATDIVVADDPSLEIGDRKHVSGGILDSKVLEGAKATIKRLLEDVIDRIKTSPEAATVLLVGGGSIIAPSELQGVGRLIRPPFFACANAVGACVADVAGELDTVEILQDRTLEEVIEQCKAKAIERAVQAGAKPETVRIVEVENLPVQYVLNKATRLIIRAVGELDHSFIAPGSLTVESPHENIEEQESEKKPTVTPSESVVDIDSYRPTVNKQGEWLLSETDLEWISEGCGVMGTGGGGSPYPAFIMARQILRDGGNIRVISGKSLPDDALIFRGCFMGAPSVSNERLPGGLEIITACKNLATYMGAQTPAAIISDEIGGMNGVQPMILASAKHLNVPVFDGDLMGRAYPNLWQARKSLISLKLKAEQIDFQLLPAVYDVPASLVPCALADGVGNSVILPSVSSSSMVETIFRSVCTDLGSLAGLSMAPLSAATCRKYGVTKSVSQAWRIGRAIATKRKNNDLFGIPAAILKVQNGKILFTGKIIDVKREVRAGFTVLRQDERLIVTFQNENLYAEASSTNPTLPKKILAVVPDLIAVLDSQSGSGLGTHEYRYGSRLDFPYHPVGAYVEPQSVVEEYMS